MLQIHSIFVIRSSLSICLNLVLVFDSSIQVWFTKRKPHLFPLACTLFSFVFFPNEFPTIYLSTFFSRFICRCGCIFKVFHNDIRLAGLVLALYFFAAFAGLHKMHANGVLGCEYNLPGFCFARKASAFGSLPPSEFCWIFFVFAGSRESIWNKNKRSFERKTTTTEKNWELKSNLMHRHAKPSNKIQSSCCTFFALLFWRSSEQKRNDLKRVRKKTENNVCILLISNRKIFMQSFLERSTVMHCDCACKLNCTEEMEIGLQWRFASKSSQYAERLPQLARMKFLSKIDSNVDKHSRYLRINFSLKDSMTCSSWNAKKKIVISIFFLHLNETRHAYSVCLCFWCRWWWFTIFKHQLQVISGMCSGAKLFEK